MRTPSYAQRSSMIPRRMLSQVVHPALGVLHPMYSLGVEFWSTFRVLDLGRVKMVLFALNRFNCGLWTR